MRIRWSWVAAGLAVTLGAALGLPTTQATSLDETLNLSTLVQQSPVIVVGTVSSVTTGRMDNNVPYVEIQVRVSRTIRGAVDGTLSFRQLNLPAAQPAENGRRYVGALPGMPSYAEGEQVLLFLGADGVQGLRTTVGLGTGKFVLVGGNAQNGFQNQGLFRDVPLPDGVRLNQKEESMFATTKGGVATDTLVSLIQRAVDEGWWNPRNSGPRLPRPAKPLTLDDRRTGTGATEFGVGGSNND